MARAPLRTGTGTGRSRSAGRVIPWAADIARAVEAAPRGGSLADWKAHAQSLLSRQPCVFVRNGQISALYAALYLRRPQLFKWAGLAAIASRHIRVALWPLRIGAAGEVIDLPRALGRWQALRITDADVIRRTNNDIFDDIFWAHLAYDGDPAGLAEIERLVRGTPQAAVGAAFRRMDEGRRLLEADRASASEIVWDANLRILEHEQRAMVQPNFERLSCAYARAFSFGATAGLDVDGLRRATAVLTSFSVYSLRRRRPSRGAPLPLLTSYDDRWAWMEGSIVPRFRRHEHTSTALRRTLVGIIAESQGHPAGART
jgi:hypothetical protein